MLKFSQAKNNLSIWWNYVSVFHEMDKYPGKCFNICTG